MLHGIDDLDYTKFFNLAVGSHTRGHTLKLVKQRTNSRLRQCVLGIRVVNDWNSLDDGIVTADSVNSFNFWKEKAFKYDPTGYHGLLDTKKDWQMLERQDPNQSELSLEYLES